MLYNQPMITVREIAAGEEAAADQVASEAFAAVRKIYRPKPAPASPIPAPPAALSRVVAVEDGVLVGTVHYHQVEDRLHLRRLAVRPRCQHRSIARRLVEHLRTLAQARHCRTLSLYTIAQTGNVPIFEKLGFHVVKSQPAENMESVTGDPLTDVYMECHLSLTA